MKQKFELSYEDLYGVQWTYIDLLTIDEAIKKLMTVLPVSAYCIYDVEKQGTFIHKKMAETKWERIAEEVEENINETKI